MSSLRKKIIKPEDYQSYIANYSNSLWTNSLIREQLDKTTLKVRKENAESSRKIGDRLVAPHS